MKENWFEEWFDSPYYHILYKDRDEAEAEFFLNNLLSHLQINPDCKILDLACGRGRHSVYLNKLGFEVTGVDLSPKSIKFASQFANEKLRFSVHDMRQVLEVEAFDLVLNLFTSFGYFGCEKEDDLVIHSVYQMLKPNGIFVLDYLNIEQKGLTGASYEKEINGVFFTINKHICEDSIVKEIKVKDGDKDFEFCEHVSAIDRKEFLSIFNDCGFKEIKTFGNYLLQEYNASESQRCIMIGHK